MTFWIPFICTNAPGWYHTKILDKVDVIKSGGRLKVGNMLARISVKEASVREQEHAKIWEKVIKGKKAMSWDWKAVHTV